MKKIFILLLFLLFSIHYVYSQQSYFLSTTPHGKKWQMYGSAVCGNYLYNIGGEFQDIGYVKNVQKAKINPDGTLGVWEETTPLPQKRGYIDNTTIVLNDIVYIVGGIDIDANNRYNTILWAKPGANGHLGKWNESPKYPGEPVNCAVAFATPGYIYLTGGRTKSTQPTADVWCATIQDDGTVSGWEKGPSLPEPLWYHSGGVAGGRVWIWGGLKTPKNTSVSNKVYFAPILGSGKIGEWSASPATLPFGFFSSPSTISGSYLISFCPRYSGARISGDVWYAQVTPQGLSPWGKTPMNIPAKLYIGLATDYRRGTVYIPGGRISKAYEFDSKVYFLKLYGSQDTATPSRQIPEFFITAEDPGSPDQNLSFMHQNAETKGAFPGFLPYAQARALATSQHKPMVLYTHSRKALEVKKQNELFQTLNADKWGGNVVFGEFDISQFPQNAQQLGIFKVPCWTFFDRDSRIRRQDYSLLNLSQIEEYVGEIVR
ncbi:hypothetical protein JW926_02930 [Candidatus Sumerlaeota bacterium]|nr:hypothetical protein [Candidatus Sumerlaeota bacterium]